MGTEGLDVLIMEKISYELKQFTDFGGNTDKINKVR